MKRLVVILLVLAFSVAPAFALTVQQEADIALTHMLVQSEADNRDLNAKLAHSKEGHKFFWTVVGMFVLYDMNRGGSSEGVVDNGSCKKKKK